MSYDELMDNRQILIDEADDLMKNYVEIADKLYRKAAGEFAGVISMDVNYDGISYEYYIDYYDFTAGRDHFYVSKEELEERIEKHLRNKKLKKLEVKK